MLGMTVNFFRVKVTVEPVYRLGAMSVYVVASKVKGFRQGS